MVNICYYIISIASYKKMPDIQPSQPTTVYKYRNCDNPNHMRMLSANEIYFAIPSEFNDPFDCAIPYTFWNTTDDAKTAEYISMIARDQPEYLALPLSKREAWVIQTVQERMKSKPITRQEQHLEELGIARLQTERFGIFSAVSDNSETGLKGYENNLMWSHYGNQHAGFCVGLNVKKLLAPAQSTMQIPENIYFEEVDYVREYPVLSPYRADGTIHQMGFDEARLILRTKDDIWKYEREWRWLIQRRYGSSAGVVKPISPDAIDSVYLGMRISNTNQESIKQILQINPSRPKLFKAHYQDGKYVLGFDEISY
jgi:hypothetical protein